MSYSTIIKSEIVKQPVSGQCCALAMLASLIHSCGSIDLGGRGRFGFTLTTENAEVMRFIYYKLFKKLVIDESQIILEESKQGRRTVYSVSVRPGETAATLLKACLIQREDVPLDFSLPHALLEKKCCFRSFLRGSFLGCGSISDVRKAYHADMVFRRERFSVELCDLLVARSINAKQSPRGNNYAVYIKESESIELFMSLIGAYQAVLDIENIKLYKEISNNANRAVNCDTANNIKTIEAAEKQIVCIRAIIDGGGLDLLPPGLRETAELRINNPDASLDELAAAHDLPVTKSGVNHRLRKLCEIAKAHYLVL